MANKHLLAQEFLIHEAVTRRQPVLSQFCSGLESLGFLATVRKAPSLFQSVFVYEQDEVTSERIVSLLNFPNKMNDDEAACVGMLKQFLANAPKDG